MKNLKKNKWENEEENYIQQQKGSVIGETFSLRKKRRDREQTSKNTPLANCDLNMKTSKLNKNWVKWMQWL